MQERLTEQILDCINDTTTRRGSRDRSISHVYDDAGVQKQNSTTTTSGFRGVLKRLIPAMSF